MQTNNNLKETDNIITEEITGHSKRSSKRNKVKSEL